MSLSSQVASDFTAALKADDELTTSCLRLVKNAMQNKEKDLCHPLNEEEAVAILKTLGQAAPREHREVHLGPTPGSGRQRGRRAGHHRALSACPT